MTRKFSIPTIFSMLLILASCNAQDPATERSATPSEGPGNLLLKKDEPHRYGGWYCPDNFGFVPVDIQKLDQVPAIADRLPTEQELKDNKSLINVDTEKYPDARALDMKLPRVARVYSKHIGMDELVIVIQAIIVQEDTVVGYRFVNGGNGSGWLTDVTFLSEEEVAAMGSQPFYYSKSVLKAPTADIWNALAKTKYFKQLGKKFDQQAFFSKEWTASSEAMLNLDTNGEKATGYVGMVYGNLYLQIDYDRDGFHYSEKLLIMENHEDQTTEFFFASGPYPEDFKKQKSNWDGWVADVKKISEAD